MNTKKIYELGYSYGKNLSDIENCKKQLGNIIQKEEIDPKIDKLNNKIGITEGKIGYVEGVIDYIKISNSKAQAELEKHKKLIEQKHLFSLFIGVLFLIVSFLLLYADTFLLGDVIRNMFGLPAVSEEDIPFQKMFIQTPIKALKNFPEILTMSLSILFMGFYLKVLEGTISENNTKWSERDIKTKTFFIIEVTVGVLSLIVLLVVAYARYDTPIFLNENGGPSFPIQLFSAIMGFTLPYVSAIFFMKGYTKTKNELKLLVLKFKILFWDLIHGMYKSRIMNLKKRVSKNINKRNSVSKYDYSKTLNSQLLEFVKGYNNAVDELIDFKDGSLYDKFKSIALRNIVNPNE